EAASPTFWSASAIHRTPAMPSASSGLRAASIAIVRSRRRYRVDRSSSRPTSSANFSSLKKTAAYARSTISSEASFSSTRRSLTFLGWSSMPDHSQYCHDEQDTGDAREIHDARDGRDGLVVRIESEPVRDHRP